jgi:lipid A 3-O-deacylase
MTRIRILCGIVALMASGALTAQSPSDTTQTDAPIAAVSNSRPWEYGALIQGGVGLEERTDFGFFMVGGHLGKVLTPQLGKGHLQGNIEYSVEVFPLWQSYTPTFERISCTGVVPVSTVRPALSEQECSAPYTVGGTYTGVSVTPIQVRWNFTHGKRFMPWIEAAGGVVWTNHKYPAVGNLDPNDPTQTGPASDTSVWNFTPQGGIGAHYFLKPRRSMDFSINAVHISSASLGDKNPGVNVSLQMSVGYTWWK